VIFLIILAEKLISKDLDELLILLNFLFAFYLFPPFMSLIWMLINLFLILKFLIFFLHLKHIFEFSKFFNLKNSLKGYFCFS